MKVDALAYIATNLHINPKTKSPIEIPDFGRDGLARLCAGLGFTCLAEIGVEHGIYNEILCRANPQATVFGVDAWKAYHGYRDHVSQWKLDAFYAEAKNRLAYYPNSTLLRMSSREAAGQFKDESLDFVYLDANHELPYLIEELVTWSHKVRVGGIVAGHDFKESSRIDSKLHIVPAIYAFTRAYRIHPWFVLGSKAILPNQVRDTPRSWMFIKQKYPPISHWTPHA